MTGWRERRRSKRWMAAAEDMCRELRWADAEQQLRAVLAAVSADDPLVASARTMLAKSLRAQGRLQEAESEARSAIDAEPVLNGVEPAAQDVLALVLGDLGRHREAVDMLAANAVARARTPGSSRWLIFKSRSDRLQNMAYLGRHEDVVTEADALKTAARSAEGMYRVLLPLTVTNALAFSHCLHGHHQEAEQLLLPALKEAGRQRLYRILTVLHLGTARALTGQNRAEEALASVDEAQDILDRAPNPAVLVHDVSAIRLARAAALHALGRHADAEGEARNCVNRCERRLGPAHHRALEAATLLGEILAAQHRHDEATALLHTTHDSWRTHFGHDHHGTVRARQALITLTDRTG